MNATFPRIADDMRHRWSATLGEYAGNERLVRGAFWSVVGAACARALSLATWILCARVLGKGAFGELSIVYSTISTLGILAAPGLGLTTTKYVAECRQMDPLRTARILCLASRVTMICGTGMAGILFLFAPFLAVHVVADSSLTTPLRAGALLVALTAINGYQLGALAGFEDFRSIARVNVSAGILILPLILPAARHGGVSGILAAFVATQLLTCILGQTELRRTRVENGVPLKARGYWRESPLLFRFALPALLSPVVLLPAMWACSAFLVRQPEGYAQLGLFAAADRWRLLLLFLPTALSGVALPVLSGVRGTGDFAGYRWILRTNLRVTLAVVAVPALLIAVSSKWIMSVFGGEYQGGAVVLAVLALVAAPEALNTVLGQSVITESMWQRLGYDVLLASVLLSAAWVLVPRWGATGLSLAYLLAFATVAVALLLHLLRHGLLQPLQTRSRSWPGH